jgi:hypothetical protein
MFEDENVIGSHDLAFLDSDQEDVVGSAHDRAHRTAHVCCAGALVVAFVELAVEVLDPALVAKARATNSKALHLR